MCIAANADNDMLSILLSLGAFKLSKANSILASVLSDISIFSAMKYQ